MDDWKGVTEGRFRNALVRYDVQTLLEQCNRASVEVGHNRGIVSGEWRSEIGGFPRSKTIHITQHQIATLAMLALQNHPWSHCQRPQDTEFIRLANNVSNIVGAPVEAPIDSDETLVSTLVRLFYQQFPFQERLNYLLPRHLLLYLDTHVSSPPVDPDAVLRDETGLAIRDFMTIGMAFFAASLERGTFSRESIESTQIPTLEPYVQPEKVAAFLSVAAADFATFRDLCLAEACQSPEAGIYRFNPLFDRPVVIRKDGLLCVPVPRLLPYAITKGLYYDFLERFGTSGGNQFSEWFGHAFEQYGGLLLRSAFGNESVFEEPVYGKSEIRGPDWVVVQGDTALVLEFRSGRFNKKAKTHADYEEIVGLLKRNVLKTLMKMPAKIEDLEAGRTGIPLSGVKNYVPCVVTYEPLYSHQLFLELLKRELHNENVPEFDFELMSIEDLEWLLAWASHGNPFRLLREKLGNPESNVMSLTELIAKRAAEKNVSKLGNPLLDRTLDTYWRGILPSQEVN